METIIIRTLIDITNSGVNRPTSGLEKEFGQHRNWTTLLQCIGLRSIITYDQNPSSELIDVKDLKFGKKYKGKQQVWTFTFNPDRSETFLDETDKLGLLKNDLHQVPVIQNLYETINMSKAVFDIVDESFKNTVVELINQPLEE